MKKSALPPAPKMDKLDPRPMTDVPVLQSEGAGMDALLDELGKERAIKEISGWDTGFVQLNRALDGVLPGLHLIVGPPGCGKTSLAKQMVDQLAMHNHVPGIFFTFAERKKELRIKTLARLSEIESREIRRGSAYLLHWYGLPKAHHAETERLSPSWDKVTKSAAAARSWLDLVYIVDCSRGVDRAQIQARIRDVQASTHAGSVAAVIDDSQRLGAIDQPLNARLPIVAERLQELAMNLEMPVIAVWPDLREDRGASPQIWGDRVPNADVIVVLEPEPEKSIGATEPNRPTTLHIVTNRGGEKGKLQFDFVPPFAKFVER